MRFSPYTFKLRLRNINVTATYIQGLMPSAVLFSRDSQVVNGDD